MNEVTLDTQKHTRVSTLYQQQQQQQQPNKIETTKPNSRQAKIINKISTHKKARTHTHIQKRNELNEN